MGLARESEGAIAVFFEDIPDSKKQPAIIQKRDGGANYTTTDLATLEYRIQTWKPDEIVYVTDERQQLHFKQLFAIFRRWMPEVKVRLSHVWFGKILGADNKPFKTRTGENIKLDDLLDEAEERALAVVTEKNPELPEAGAQRDRAHRRPRRDQILRPRAESPERLRLQLGKNARAQWKHRAVSAICLHARSQHLPQGRGIHRPKNVSPIFALTAPDELALAKHLINFGLVLEAVVDDYRPNYLCTYLYELAGHFARFYENCPSAESRATGKSGPARALRPNRPRFKAGPQRSGH